jgi:hypothetical protein
LLIFGSIFFELNYFNYFTEIEDAFVRRRGKHLYISSMDWALIETWKGMDIPLHVALRGIEKAFDSWESKPRKRSVKSLLYCQEEVEAQYAEWREARVGAGEPEEQDQNGAQPKSESEGPFTRSAILEHMKQGRLSLAALCKRRMKVSEDDFCDALNRAVARLTELEQEIEPPALLDSRKLETSLTGLERMLSDSLRSVLAVAEVAAVEAEVKAQFKPYRKLMEPAAYKQTVENLLLKRLREQYGLPRLSLFFL